MTTNYKPEGYPDVCAYLLVPDVAAQVAFLTRVFGATPKEELHAEESGEVRHAEVRIGDSVIMMGKGGGEWGTMTASIYVYVKDTDAAYQRALDEGATSVMAPADQFYGDRNGGVKDAAGNIWWISTHVEDVSAEEMERRAKERWKNEAR
jgi:PhnB protein